MAVPAGPTDKRYTGNGVTKIFTIPFLLLAASDLDVFLDGVEISSGFVITDAENPTSTITFAAAPADQSDIYLQLNVPFERLNDYQENGDFLSSTINRDLDRIWQALKQLLGYSRRALTLGATDIDGSGAYRAKGNRISDLADPINQQDAATKNWVGLFIDSVSGAINTTVGIAYDAGTLFDYLRFGVGRTVDSIADLRQLSGSRNQRAFVLGYYTRGDEGGGAYYIDSADTTSLDNGGTIIIGAGGVRWKLARTGWVTPEQFGSKVGVDSYAALQAAHNAYPMVRYAPNRTYLSSNKIVCNAPFGFEGGGVNSTIVVFTGATAASIGYQVTQIDYSQNVTAKSMSIQKTAGGTAGTGLLIDGSSQFAGTGGGHQIIGKRTENRCFVDNLDFRGTTDNSGFSVGVNFKSLLNFSGENINNRGDLSGWPLNPLGVGVMVSGDGIPIDFSLRRIWGYYCYAGVHFPDYIEGGHVREFEFVNTRYGVLGRYQPGVSTIAQALCGNLGCTISEGHANVLTGGVIMDGANQTKVRDLNLYLQPQATDIGSSIGLQLFGGAYNVIDGVFTSGDGALNSKSANYGVLLTNCSESTVDACSGSNLLAPVGLVNTSGTQIDMTTATSCVNVIHMDASSGGNRTGMYKYSGLSGVPVNNISPNNDVGMPEYSGQINVNFAGASSYTLNVGLPIGCFFESPTFGALSIDGSIAHNFQYRRSTSTALNAVFVITPVGTASLESSTVSIFVNLKGK